jgi:hypothetical protein
MARFYTNENFPEPAVEKLREMGHDVLTTHMSGNSGLAIPDEAVLEFAISEQRILVTLNRQDFIRLHKKNADHWGVVVCTFDPDFASLAERIHSSIMEYEDVQGILIRINRPNPPNKHSLPSQ